MKKLSTRSVIATLIFASNSLAYPAPVPATVYLFGTCLVGLIGLRRCKNKVKAFTA